MTPKQADKPGPLARLLSYVLHAYFVWVRGLTLGVRAIVRAEGNRFLLVRHTYTAGWHFPGGGVERGETAEWALRRELRDETGLELVGSPVLHGVFLNRSVNDRDHVLAYCCEAEGVLPEKSVSIEIAEVGYFDLDNLPDPTDPGTVRRMREIVYGDDLTQAW